MIQNNENIDVTKVEEYIAQVEEFKKRYKDKKSELEWADDEWEESIINDEMQKYANKIKSLNQQIAAIQQHQNIA